MRQAREASIRELPKILANAKERYGEPFHEDAGDIIMEEWAKRATELAKGFAPVDTGELAHGIEGKGIHWFKVRK